jgi:hypothetical protein
MEFGERLPALLSAFFVEVWVDDKAIVLSLLWFCQPWESLNENAGGCVAPERRRVAVRFLPYNLEQAYLLPPAVKVEKELLGWSPAAVRKLVSWRPYDSGDDSCTT